MATEADFNRIGNYARMYNPQQNINRLNATRTVPMQVLCLGYSRTGTLSMHKAMTILGYPSPYHFSSMNDNIIECDLWMQALNAKYNGKGKMPDKKFFDGMLGHVGAVTDAPCILFAKELVEFYPEAKVVLVERDIESWFESWMAFVEGTLNPVLQYVALLDPSFVKRMADVGNFIVSVQSGYGRNIDEVRVRSKNAYRHHYRDVKEMVPGERLLNFRLQDGWKPLCEFLGKEEPGVPFPHENEKAANQQSLVEAGQLAMKRILRKVVLTVTAVGIPAAAYWYRLGR